MTQGPFSAAVSMVFLVGSWLGAPVVYDKVTTGEVNLPKLPDLAKLKLPQLPISTSTKTTTLTPTKPSKTAAEAKVPEKETASSKAKKKKEQEEAAAKAAKEAAAKKLKEEEKEKAAKEAAAKKAKEASKGKEDKEAAAKAEKEKEEKRKAAREKKEKDDKESAAKAKEILENAVKAAQANTPWGKLGDVSKKIEKYVMDIDKSLQGPRLRDGLLDFLKQKKLWKKVEDSGIPSAANQKLDSLGVPRNVGLAMLHLLTYFCTLFFVFVVPYCCCRKKGKGAAATNALDEFDDKPLSTPRGSNRGGKQGAGGAPARKSSGNSGKSGTPGKKK